MASKSKNLKKVVEEEIESEKSQEEKEASENKEDEAEVEVKDNEEDNEEDSKEESKNTQKESKKKDASEDDQKNEDSDEYTESDLKGLKIDELKQICKKKNLPVSGTKDTLIKRILNPSESKSAPKKKRKSDDSSAASSRSASGRSRSKKYKDPFSPKKAKSGFFIFQSDMKDVYKKKFIKIVKGQKSIKDYVSFIKKSICPEFDISVDNSESIETLLPIAKSAQKDGDISSVQVSKLMGLAWKRLDPAEKKKYIAKAEKETETYKEARKKYEEDNPRIIFPKLKQDAMKHLLSIFALEMIEGEPSLTSDSGHYCVTGKLKCAFTTIPKGSMVQLTANKDKLHVEYMLAADYENIKGEGDSWTEDKQAHEKFVSFHSLGLNIESKDNGIEVEDKKEKAKKETTPKKITEKTSSKKENVKENGVDKKSKKTKKSS